MLGPRATPQLVTHFDHLWGLDRSLPLQYWLFLRRLLHGDLGTSLFYQVGVGRLVLDHITATLVLLLGTMLFSILLTIPLATLAAAQKGKLADQLVRGGVLIGLGMPPFWLGILLITLFSLRLRLFPVGGYGTTLLAHVHAIILPSLTMALVVAPILIRNLRVSILEVVGADYVVTAQAKGLSRSRIWIHHIGRNAVLPTVTLLGLSLGFLVGGTVVVESVFALPGIGNLMLQGVLTRDFPIIQGVTLVFAIGVIGVNLLTDLVYLAVDPRASLAVSNRRRA
jgi:peptide/nickel transport system permease protein